MTRAVAFLLALTFSFPAQAYKEFSWLIKFNNAQGINCMGSKHPSCTTSCHWDEAQQISLEAAQSSGLGSVIVMSMYGEDVPVVINAVYPTMDKDGTAWVTRWGCLFKYTGG